MVTTPPWSYTPRRRTHVRDERRAPGWHGRAWYGCGRVAAGARGLRAVWLAFGSARPLGVPVSRKRSYGSVRRVRDVVAGVGAAAFPPTRRTSVTCGLARHARRRRVLSATAPRGGRRAVPERLRVPGFSCARTSKNRRTANQRDAHAARAVAHEHGATALTRADGEPGHGRVFSVRASAVPNARQKRRRGPFQRPRRDAFATSRARLLEPGKRGRRRRL